jgi:hypothetical protein
MNHLAKSAFLLSAVVSIFFTAAPYASAQSSNAKGTPAESKPGQSTVSTYARDKIETVNLANGNFSLSIPLPRLVDEALSLTRLRFPTTAKCGARNSTRKL